MLVFVLRFVILVIMFVSVWVGLILGDEWWLVCLLFGFALIDFNLGLCLLVMFN